MEEMWLARDSNNLLYLYVGSKPYKYDFVWDNLGPDLWRLDSDLFPEVQWSDAEPTKVKLVIER